MFYFVYFILFYLIKYMFNILHVDLWQFYLYDLFYCFNCVLLSRSISAFMIFALTYFRSSFYVAVFYRFFTLMINQLINSCIIYPKGNPYKNDTTTIINTFSQNMCIKDVISHFLIKFIAGSFI